MGSFNKIFILDQSTNKKKITEVDAQNKLENLEG